MKTILAVVPATVLLAACASTGMSGMSMSSSSPEYWRSPTNSIDAFRHDNVVCSARAAKFGNVDNQSVPDNRMDRPMQKWPNSVAQETYEGCMRDVGWRPVG